MFDIHILKENVSCVARILLLIVGNKQGSKEANKTIRMVGFRLHERDTNFIANSEWRFPAVIGSDPLSFDVANGSPSYFIGFGNSFMKASLNRVE